MMIMTTSQVTCIGNGTWSGSVCNQGEYHHNGKSTSFSLRSSIALGGWRMIDRGPSVVHYNYMH